MFYSHEILTSHQYGVATVWLVATIGPRSNFRRITRKAILGVDVSKACDTIIDPPGAPIALRLQANLLFGVSRVYSQQCNYVLTDAEKIQEHMRKFYSVWGTNTIDTNAGKAKRHQLILKDDPAFDINMNMPELVLDINLDDLRIAGNGTQGTSKTTSQLSPLERRSASAGPSPFHGGLQIPRSSSLSILGANSPFAQEHIMGLKPQDDLFGLRDDDELPIGDFGFTLDEMGNIVEDEPELPRMPGSQGNEDVEMRDAQDGHLVSDYLNPIMDIDNNLGMDLDAAPAAAGDMQAMLQQQEAEEQASPDHAVAVQPRRKRGRKAKNPAIDAEGTITVARAEFRSWTENYLDNMERARKTPRTTSVGQARRNAVNLIFNAGVPGAGQLPGAQEQMHPLAEFFGTQALQARFLGFVVDVADEAPRRGRRRSSNEAFGEEGDEEERRVRPRLDDNDNGNPELGRALLLQQDDGLPMILGDEQDIETGRAPGSALSDHASLPWHRPSSQVPGSSVMGSAQRNSARKLPVEQQSPLVGRGSAVHDIERFSDQPHFSSDGLQQQQPPHYSDSNIFSYDGAGAFAPAAEFGHSSGANTSQVMRDALDREGQSFLSFVERVAQEKGEMRDGVEDDGRRWVVFDGLFQQEDQTRPTVAQAFYHVLSLATKGVIRVEQAGQNRVAFGAIHVGVTLTDEDEDDFELPEQLGGRVEGDDDDDDGEDEDKDEDEDEDED